jgi:DNA-binding NtrC family response regulator
VILITGETGTGKEVLARYIHETGPRSDMPFVKVDCATIPSALMESQLFGHVRGAFTGATADHKGFFEQADQGTLFLDEVGNLDLQTQSKLLQFFNDYTITPVGGAGPRRLNVHCVLATNSDLSRMVRTGRFREDLYYRIYNIVLSLPPLRKRPLDIPVLCRHFLDHYARKAGREFKGFSKEAMDKLLSWEWPGNVRELQTVVQRAALFASGDFVGAEDIQLSKGKEEQRKKRTPFRISMTDRKVVEEALKSSQGVVSKAAKALGIDRRTLYNFMNSQNLRPDQFRQGLTFTGPPA